MRKILQICFGFLIFTLSASNAMAQALSLDALFDWKNPLSLTVAKIEQAYGANVEGGPWFTRKELDQNRIMFHSHGSNADNSQSRPLEWGPRKIKAVAGTVFLGEQGVTSIIVDFSGADVGDTFTEPLILEICELVGGATPFKTERYLSKSDYHMPIFRWVFDGYYIDLRQYIKDSPWSLGIFRGLAPSENNAPVEAVAVNRRKTEADLDPLLNFETFWGTTQTQFEELYIPNVEKQEKPPQFEWLSAAKDRARFSRKMFSNLETNLTLFANNIKAEEAIIEFANGKAARATISVYNRGDSGEISIQEFDRMFRKIGQNLGTHLKVAPRRQISAGNAAVKIVSWVWTTPTGIALLEHNDFQTPGQVGKPEFLRLKLAAPDQAGWTMGKLSLGVQRMALQNNVTKNAEGDIYIAGVPMVDQGAKGYCVAASCQRLFEYMRIPCDQHEMAQLLNVDVVRGANAIEMQKSLAKVDQKFGVAFKPLVNPELYYDNRGKRRVSLKEFAGIIREHTSKGVPLLWALEIGKYEENPPLPSGGQVRGGHMRMLIGYNSAKNEVIFTDSWGAGHELKRMAAEDAYEVTLGIYSMSPRGL